MATLRILEDSLSLTVKTQEELIEKTPEDLLKFMDDNFGKNIFIVDLTQIDGLDSKIAIKGLAVTNMTLKGSGYTLKLHILPQHKQLIQDSGAIAKTIEYEVLTEPPRIIEESPPTEKIDIGTASAEMDIGTTPTKKLGDEVENVSTTKADEEAKAEEETRKKAEEEAKLKAEEAKLKAEEEAKLKAEEEAKLKAEEEAKLKAEEEAKLKAEEEAKLKAEEEAKLKAEPPVEEEIPEPPKVEAPAEEPKAEAPAAEAPAAEEIPEPPKVEAPAEEPKVEAPAEEEIPEPPKAEAPVESEEAKLKAEEEAKLKAEEEAKLKAEEEAKLKAEEEAKLKAEEEAKLKAEEEAKLKAEEEAKLKAEEEAKLKAEEEAKLKAEEEAKLKAEEEAKLKAEEEAKLKAEEEAKLKAEAPAEEPKVEAPAEEPKAEAPAEEEISEPPKVEAPAEEPKAEAPAEEEIPEPPKAEAPVESEEAKLKAEEEAKLKAEEEAKLKAEEEAKLKAEEEAKLKAEEEAKLKAEEEAKLKAEEEAKLKAEEEAKLKAEEEAKLKAEEEAKLKAEEEAKLKAEEEAKLKAEEEAKLKAEEEAKLKAEEEAKLKAEEEAKLKAEEEAKLKAEEEAKLKAEEEAKLKAEEEEEDLDKLVADVESIDDSIPSSKVEEEAPAVEYKKAEDDDELDKIVDEVDDIESVPDTPALSDESAKEILGKKEEEPHPEMTPEEIQAMFGKKAEEKEKEEDLDKLVADVESIADSVPETETVENKAPVVEYKKAEDDDELDKIVDEVDDIESVPDTPALSDESAREILGQGGEVLADDSPEALMKIHQNNFKIQNNVLICSTFQVSDYDAAFEVFYDEVLAKDPKQAYVDFTKLEKLDASIAKLIALIHMMRKKPDQEVTLRIPQGPVLDVFKKSGIDRMFKVDVSLPEIAEAKKIVIHCSSCNNDIQIPEFKLNDTVDCAWCKSPVKLTKESLVIGGKDASIHMEEDLMVISLGAEEKKPGASTLAKASRNKVQQKMNQLANQAVTKKLDEGGLEGIMAQQRIRREKNLRIIKILVLLSVVGIIGFFGYSKYAAMKWNETAIVQKPKEYTARVGDVVEIKGKLVSDKSLLLQGPKQVFIMRTYNPDKYYVAVDKNDSPKVRANRLLNKLRDNQPVFIKAFGEVKRNKKETFRLPDGRQTREYIAIKYDDWDELFEHEFSEGVPGLRYFEYINRPKPEKNK